MVFGWIFSGMDFYRSALITGRIVFRMAAQVVGHRNRTLLPDLGTATLDINRVRISTTAHYKVMTRMHSESLGECKLS